jgi:hypothetical protein
MKYRDDVLYHLAILACIACVCRIAGLPILWGFLGSLFTIVLSQLLRRY